MPGVESFSALNSILSFMTCSVGGFSTPSLMPSFAESVGSTSTVLRRVGDDRDDDGDEEDEKSKKFCDFSPPLTDDLADAPDAPDADDSRLELEL